MTTIDARRMVMKLIAAVVENEFAGPNEREAAREDFIQQRDAVIGEIERLRAECNVLKARALAMLFKLPDETTCGELQKDAAAILEWMKNR